MAPGDDRPPAGAAVDRMAAAGPVRDVERGPTRLDDGQRDRLVAVRDGQVGGGADRFGQTPEHRPGGVGDERLGSTGKMQHPGTEAQATARVPADHAVFDQRRCQPVHDRPADPEPIGGLRHRQAAGDIGDQLQQAQPTVERLRGLGGTGRFSHSRQAYGYVGRVTSAAKVPFACDVVCPRDIVDVAQDHIAFEGQGNAAGSTVDRPAQGRAANMPGNSERRGKRTTAKKGAPSGSGGKRRESLKGRGKTLPADERPWHKGYSGTEDVPQRTQWKQEKEKRAADAEGRTPKIGKPGTKDTTFGRGTKPGRAAAAHGGAKTRTGGTRGGPRVAAGRKSQTPRDAPELLVGRNPVVEALRSRIPATALYVAAGVDMDDRITEAVRIAADRGIALLEITRNELDRMTGGVLNQGIGLSVPPYAYESFDDLVANAAEQTAPLLVALDGVTDPRNLGAVVRSAAAFGAHGVFLPERRASGITATAWRTSAGAAARIPIAQVTNLTRALKECQDAGFMVVGLDADGATSIYDLEAAIGPIVVVVGSEGRGLSRLVGETCDLRVAIPMTTDIESLNASVAAAVTLAEIARRRSI